MKNVLIFGAGSSGKKLYKQIHEFFHVIGIIDNNKKLQGTQSVGLEIYAPEHEITKSADYILIASQYAEEILKQIDRDLPYLKVKIMSASDNQCLELTANNPVASDLLDEVKRRNDNEIVVADIFSIKEWARQDNGRNSVYYECGRPEQIKYENIEIGIRYSSVPYVATLKNVRVFSKTSTLLVGDNIALNDLAGSDKFGSSISLHDEPVVFFKSKDKVFLDYRGYKTVNVKSGIFLGGAGSVNFGHWLPEYISKLEYLKHHPNFSKIPIIVDAGMPSSHLEYLKIITTNEILIIDNKEVFLCNELLTAPKPTFFPFHVINNDVSLLKDIYKYSKFSLFPPSSIKFIKDLFHEKLLPIKPPVKQRKIYLSRRKGFGRFILNEEDVMAFLLKKGFEIVYPEELSAREQIFLFTDAKFIISARSSGLFNLIFSDKKINALILSNRFFESIPYCIKMEDVMLAAGYESIKIMLGSPIPKMKNSRFSYDKKYEDFYIDISNLQLEIDRMDLD